MRLKNKTFLQWHRYWSDRWEPKQENCYKHYQCLDFYISSRLEKILKRHKIEVYDNTGLYEVNCNWHEPEFWFKQDFISKD